MTKEQMWKRLDKANKMMRTAQSLWNSTYKRLEDLLSESGMGLGKSHNKPKV